MKTNFYIVRNSRSDIKYLAKRKYCPTYIKYGFITIERGGESLPQCVICMKTRSESTTKPSLLKRHLATNCVKEKQQDESNFQQLGENAKRQRLNKAGVIYQKKKGIVKASYEIALLTAKSMKAHTIAKLFSGNASSKDNG